MAVDNTFQSAVNIEPAIGLPGGYAAVNPIISTPLGYIAKTACPVGGFVWEDNSDAGQVNPSGSGQPLLFVSRTYRWVLMWRTPILSRLAVLLP